MTIDKLINIIKKNNPSSDETLVRLAYEFAERAHAGQKRATGVDYIQHSLSTARTLAELRLPLSVIIAGILHDVPEDSKVYTLEDIRHEFGTDIASMVEGITKLSRVKYRGIDRYVENLRKMFVAMAQDIRVIIIKFADRLNNLQTLYALPADKQKRIALETLEIYTPIANRLGMGEIQSRLEDASFQYAYPDDYARIAELVKDNYVQKSKNLTSMIKKLETKLNSENVHFTSIYGREKHYYSLFRKLQKYNNDFKQIYDLVAMRVIVESITDCYAVLGIVHNLWKPIRGRIKDYIAQPKPNGYQSLHTSVFGDDQEIVEVQIRTEKMHEQAELGIAAHWKYKNNKTPDKEIAWVAELANWLKDVKDNDMFLEEMKVDVFQNRIFVFTPNGDVIDLPEGATPIDFAYHIHTEIGNKCSQALVNNEMVTLDHPLKNGDVIQVVTDKNRKGPNSEWLKFVKTRTARSQIENFRNRDWIKFLHKTKKTK